MGSLTSILGDLSTAAAVVSAFVAIVAAVVAFWGARCSQALAVRGLRDLYVSEVRVWADKVCQCMSSASHLCTVNDKSIFHDRLFGVKSELSALIDSGRWFFQNEDQDMYGLHKLRAFRGFRPTILDSLVEAYKIVDDSDCFMNESSKLKIWDCRKAFVSEAQRVLDPKTSQDLYLAK